MTSRPHSKFPPWLWPNLLGLDAPAVAVLWQIHLSRSFAADVPMVLHAVLGLSVWCIYLADRLYDAWRSRSVKGVTDRHLFTRKHFDTLSAALGIAAAINLVLIIRHVPEKLVVSGLITALLLGAYYLIRLTSGKKIASIIPREILCGMLFALGCVITPQALAPSDPRLWMAAISFGLVCSITCILISVWEKEEDIATGDHSLATSHPRLGKFLARAIATTASLSAILAMLGPWQIYAAVALSAVAQFVALGFGGGLPKPLLRVLADAVLLTPLLFLWI